MSLKEKIDEAIKNAMRAKEQDILRALRGIKSLILLEETKDGTQGPLKAEQEMAILTKAAKQRRESLEIYMNQNRPDLAEKEKAELDVIESFLPKQLTETELETRISTIIGEVGASTAADLGKVMGVATKQLAGQADGKAIAAMVKKLLG